MGRYLAAAALVVGVVETATHVVTLGSTIVVVVNALSGPAAEPFRWWHAQIVLSAAIRTVWTGIVSYATVRVCRSVEGSTAPATR